MEGVLSKGVLSRNGLCLEGVMYGGGFVRGGFVRGGFVRGGFVRRGFCPCTVPNIHWLISFVIHMQQIEMLQFKTYLHRNWIKHSQMGRYSEVLPIMHASDATSICFSVHVE